VGEWLSGSKNISLSPVCGFGSSLPTSPGHSRNSFLPSARLFNPLMKQETSPASQEGPASFVAAFWTLSLLQNPPPFFLPSSKCQPAQNPAETRTSSGGWFSLGIENHIGRRIRDFLSISTLRMGWF